MSTAARSMRLNARLYDGDDPVRVSAFPYWLNPFQWYGVVETPAFFATMQVDSLVPDVDPDGRMRIQRKPEETPVTLAAKSSAPGPRLPGLVEVSHR